MTQTSPETPADDSIPTALPEAGELHTLVVVNRFSSNYTKAVEQFRRLQLLGFAKQHDYVETSANRIVTAARIGDALTAGNNSFNSIACLTGDGGANTVGRALHMSSDDRVSKKPMICGACGGACDGHRMTQGYDKKYIEHLPGQPVVPLYPLEISITSDDTQAPAEIALFHMGIGESSQISHNINAAAHRTSKLIGRPILHQVQEGITGAYTFMQTRSHLIKSAQSGEYSKNIEWVIVNGHRMGRQNIFPGNLTEQGFCEAFVPTRKRLVRYALELFTGNTSCFSFAEQSVQTIKAQDSSHGLRIHFDGETADLNSRANTTLNTIEVRASPRPIYIASQLC